MDSDQNSFNITQGFLCKLKLFLEGSIGFHNIFDEKLDPMPKTFELRGNSYTGENVPYEAVRILEDGLE